MDGTSDHHSSTERAPDARERIAAENARCALAVACAPGDIAPLIHQDRAARLHTNIARLVAARTFVD